MLLKNIHGIILIFNDTDLMVNYTSVFLGNDHEIFFGLDSLDLNSAFKKESAYLRSQL